MTDSSDIQNSCFSARVHRKIKRNYDSNDSIMKISEITPSTKMKKKKKPVLKRKKPQLFKIEPT